MATYFDDFGNVVTPHIPAYHEEENMFYNTVHFEYIASPDDTLDNALAMIESSELVAVDCEGVMLGRKGTLCLLQLATHDTVYIFDVLSLGKELFDRGMKRILESGAVTKVFYDCRGDSDILFHQYGVRLKGVVDLALTEVYFRYKQGMGVPRYFKGYRKCVETYLPSSDPYFHYIKEQVCSAMSSTGTTFWKERPLALEVLEYAAYDVKYLRELHILLSSSLARDDLRVIKKGSYKFAKMTRDQEEIGSPTQTADWARVPTFFVFVGEPSFSTSPPYSPYAAAPQFGSPYVPRSYGSSPPSPHAPPFVPLTPINVSIY
jgi:hypothetical protein